MWGELIVISRSTQKLTNHQSKDSMQSIRPLVTVMPNIILLISRKSPIHSAKWNYLVSCWDHRWPWSRCAEPPDLPQVLNKPMSIDLCPCSPDRWWPCSIIIHIIILVWSKWLLKLHHGLSMWGPTCIAVSPHPYNGVKSPREQAGNDSAPADTTCDLIMVPHNTCN